MPLPLVFRRIAQLELDESVLWYENKRVGLGMQFRVEIEKHLERIANQPPTVQADSWTCSKCRPATFSLFNILLARSRQDSCSWCLPRSTSASKS